VAKIVFEKKPKWSWVICGDGPGYENIRQKIKELKLHDHVTLVGRVSNIEEYYKKASMFVLTSRTECLPMVLIEAQTHKLPIVAFDVSAGVKTIVKNGINGTLIRPFDVHSMAKHIIELIENPPLRMSFSQNAANDLHRFHPVTVTRKWIKLFETIL
jgi:glycosyltransferase involved in cell wall biosynthesis